MRKVSLLIMVWLGLACFSEAQQIVELRPDAQAGKDAMLHGLPSLANQNFGDQQQFPAASWTFTGIPGNLRSVIAFDFSSIPAQAQITAAYLSLYAIDNASGQGFHSGDNAAWIERITTQWEENTVTWSNQPATTTHNRVALPASQSAQQHYENIDITALVVDSRAQPQASFGFMIKLQNESILRRLNFCSSDHPNKELHPKLVIQYEDPLSLDKPQANFLFVYPNPAADLLYLPSDIETTGHFYITNALGFSVLKQISLVSSSCLDISRLPAGLYYIVDLKNNRQHRFMKAAL